MASLGRVSATINLDLGIEPPDNLPRIIAQVM